MQREYRRHLPHQIPEGMPIFLTWNLKGAMPRVVIERLERERKQLQCESPRQGETARQRALRHGKIIFAQADEFLDSASGSPLDLREPICAKAVEDSILFGAADRYELFAWCVMANHVHVLLTPVLALAKITQGLKGFTAREINRHQQQVGRIFWQDESFDHWARDDEELLRIIAYIENNPVRAGLCASPEDWPWSSARLRQQWPVGQAFQPDVSQQTAGELSASG